MSQSHKTVGELGNLSPPRLLIMFSITGISMSFMLPCKTGVIGESLTGTFFCVTTATLSLPLTAMLVFPAALTALKAYSASCRRDQSYETVHKHVGSALKY